MKQWGIFTAILAMVIPGNSQDQPTKAGTATLVVGEVTYQLPGEDMAKKLTTGMELVQGASITTGSNSRVVVLTSRQSAIRIGSGSTVVLDEMTAEAGPDKKPRVQVHLRKGSLGALIKSKELGAMDFSVKTPHGVAAARGTFYAVAVTEEKSYTQVKEGIVEVKTDENGKNPDAEKDELGRAIPPKEEE